MPGDKNLLWALPSHPTSQASTGGPNEHLQVGTNKPGERWSVSKLNHCFHSTCYTTVSATATVWKGRRQGLNPRPRTVLSGLVAARWLSTSPAWARCRVRCLPWRKKRQKTTRKIQPPFKSATFTSHFVSRWSGKIFLTDSHAQVINWQAPIYLDIN